ncbi:hypothetical protein RB195_019704 [Necator americanus]|uniref:Uncharacterized protein n=1 Tax=Necator americanus TaxID=51031 RepID=A0ABR1CGF9_NECAM
MISVTTRHLCAHAAFNCDRSKSNFSGVLACDANSIVQGLDERQQETLSKLPQYLSGAYAALQETRVRDRLVVSIGDNTIYSRLVPDDEQTLELPDGHPKIYRLLFATGQRPSPLYFKIRFA